MLTTYLLKRSASGREMGHGIIGMFYDGFLMRVTQLRRGGNIWPGLVAVAQWDGDVTDGYAVAGQHETTNAPFGERR